MKVKEMLRKTTVCLLAAAVLCSTLGLSAFAAEQEDQAAEENTDDAGTEEEPDPVFYGAGSKYEYGHFTVEAIAVDANSEEMNPNPSFSLYHIMDYTAENPYADSTPTNGVTDENNTSSMYVIVSGEDALMVDLGNGPVSTASQFGEDSEDQAVCDRIDQELRDLVLSLVGDRDFKIAITHNHGDHTGYATAFAGLGYTVYFPEGDVNDSIEEQFADYDLQPFVPGELSIPVGEITVDTILCAGHTDASTLYVISTPYITYSYDATNATATYIVMTGDALGSGSSVWIFTLDGLNMLNDGIDEVVSQLEEYTSYDAGLGAGEETGADMLILGGHGWQYENRFGTMNMNLEYVKSMQNLIHALSDGDKWRYQGVDGNSVEDWMKEGYIALKDAETRSMYTAYFGTTLTSSAAITCTLDVMRQYAGLIPVEE